jgi:predicted component of type VI protein secretion system
MASITLFLAGNKVGTYTIKSSPFTVGRDKGCGLPIENIGVSRRHCQYVYEDSSFWVEDIGSSNGTFMSGKKVVQRTRVADGDEITMGKYVMLFEDKGMDLLPQQAGEAGGVAKPAAAALTFQMDGETLRRQMSKASAAAEGQVQAQRAADVGKRFDPDAPLVIKGKEYSGSLLATAIKLLGITIIVAGVLIGLLVAFS